MRRLLRWAFNLSAVVSAALLFAALASWLASASAPKRTGALDGYYVQCSEGCVHLRRQPTHAEEHEDALARSCGVYFDLPGLPPPHRLTLAERLLARAMAPADHELIRV